MLKCGILLIRTLKSVVRAMNFPILKDVTWWCMQAGSIIFAGIAVLLAMEEKSFYKLFIAIALIFMAIGVRRASMLTKNNQQK